MKNILLAITLCTSIICYSADNTDNKPNHVIGVAGATGYNYAVRRGFIDEGKTYVCTIAHTSDSYLNKDILQQIAHAVFKKHMEPNLTLLDFASAFSNTNKNINWPTTYNINIVSLMVINQKSVVTIRAKKIRMLENQSVIFLPKPETHTLENKQYQSFKTNCAALIPIECSANLSNVNNSDDVAQQIAWNTNDLNNELILSIRTIPLDQQASMCTIS